MHGIQSCVESMLVHSSCWEDVKQTHMQPERQGTKKAGKRGAKFLHNQYESFVFEH